MEKAFTIVQYAEFTEVPYACQKKLGLLKAMSFKVVNKSRNIFVYYYFSSFQLKHMSTYANSPRLILAPNV